MNPASTLLRSQIRCRACDTVIASLNRHDFNSCECGKVAIDGGRDYLRIVGSAQSDGEAGWDYLSISVPGVLSNADAASVLAVYKALDACLKEAEDQRDRVGVRTGWPAAYINRGVPTCDIESRAKSDQKDRGYALSRFLTVRAMLDLLVQGGSVEKVAPGRWKPLVPLAERADA